MTNYPDLRVSLHVILAPFLQLTLLNIDFRLVHYLQIEFTILFCVINLAILCVLNEFQYVIAIYNDFFLFLSCHVAAQNLSYDLSVKHLLELIDGVFMFRSILSQ